MHMIKSYSDRYMHAYNVIIIISSNLNIILLLKCRYGGLLLLIKDNKAKPVDPILQQINYNS